MSFPERSDYGTSSLLLDSTVYVPWTIFTFILTLIRNCILLIVPINLQLHSVSISTILFQFH